MKKSFVVVLAVILALGIGSVAYASSSYVIKSNGILRYDGNGDGDFTDSEDVVFDSNDLVNINNQVITLQTGLEDFETQLQAVESDVEQLREDVDSVSDSLGGMRFGVDANGNYGYYEDGADTVTPF